MELRTLGRSDIRITPIGLGCWQFSGGEGMAGRYWPALDGPTTRAIVRASLAGGINWFDTAEAYGNGNSERALSDALQHAGVGPDQVRVATKWLPLLRTAGSVGRTIDERIRCLSPYPIDLHQVHSAFGMLSAQRSVMNAMAHLVENGQVRSVGVSNYGEQQMRLAYRYLAERGIPLVSNQVRYSLLDRRIERNGVLEAAQELGITIIAYSPLAQGILTGKFHVDPSLVRERGGPRRWLKAFRKRGLEQSQPLIDVLRRIARNHAATPGQVALQWLVRAHGETVLAIPGATTVEQAKQNAACLVFEMTELELEEVGATPVTARGR